jgi:hypothetical protein
MNTLSMEFQTIIRPPIKTCCVSQVLITALASISLGTMLSTDSMYNLSHKSIRTSTPEMELCVYGLLRIYVYEILIFMQRSASLAGNSRPAAQDISPF